MNLVTSELMRQIDRAAIEKHRIPSQELMENAGRGIAELLILQNIIDPATNANVVIYCGKGNNGGDGFVVGRYLHDAGIIVHIYFIGPADKLSDDAKLNYKRAVEAGVEIAELKNISDIDKDQNCTHIIDAIFGTGFEGAPHGLAAELIGFINQQNATVTSIDLPSGLNADDGTHQGVVVQADFTFTLALPKYGLYLSPGRELAGHIEVVPIGIPEKVVEQFKLPHQLITIEMVASKLPKRKPNGHKGDFGYLLIIAGSTGLTGAAELTANSAMRSGCGMVRVACPSSVQPVLATKLTEIMTHPLPDVAKKGALALRGLGEIRQLALDYDALALGPGIGRHHETIELVKRFVTDNEKPIVIDADGLYAIGSNSSILKDSKAPMVLTPHAGEFKRLTGNDAATDIHQRFEMALSFSKEYNVTLLLKGSPTIIVHPSGRFYLNPTGNSGMAKGGSGDVLTGIIGSLMAQGLSPEDAAVCGAYIHGLAGDFAADALTPRAMIAGDIIDFLPGAFAALE
jgi:NAD(P)H-hydrate epimerase